MFPRKIVTQLNRFESTSFFLTKSLSVKTEVICLLSKDERFFMEFEARLSHQPQMVCLPKLFAYQPSQLQLAVN